MSRFAPLLLCLPLALAGCFRDPPYVLHSGEFNRSSANFAQEPKDISSVIICLNKRGATSDDVLKLAQGECSKFKKAAQFKSEDYSSCPLLTPISANYDCVDPRLAVSKPSISLISSPGGRGVSENRPDSGGAGGPFYYSSSAASRPARSSGSGSGGLLTYSMPSPASSPPSAVSGASGGGDDGKFGDGNPFYYSSSAASRPARSSGSGSGGLLKYSMPSPASSPPEASASDGGPFYYSTPAASGVPTR